MRLFFVCCLFVLSSASFFANANNDFWSFKFGGLSYHTAKKMNDTYPDYNSVHNLLNIEYNFVSDSAGYWALGGAYMIDTWENDTYSIGGGYRYRWTQQTVYYELSGYVGVTSRTQAYSVNGQYQGTKRVTQPLAFPSVTLGLNNKKWLEPHVELLVVPHFRERDGNQYMVSPLLFVRFGINF